MSGFLQREVHDGVATWMMNRPGERNALSDDDQFDEFVAACREANADASTRVVILTGAGPAFCAGGNVKDMAERTGMFGGGPEGVRANYRSGIQRIPLAIDALEVPIIAAVNGPAIGAGCDLACMCDVRIASTRATFGEVFVKLGLIPGDGGAWFLQRAVGFAKAAEMTFCGEPIDAGDALACGLVSKVVPPEKLLDEARALAGRMAANPTGAVRMAKRLMREARHAQLASVLELSAAFQAIAHHTDAHEQSLRRLAPRGGSR